MQNQREEQEQDKLCHLCNRETPLYFYQQEDVVRRLPERTLTKLLQDLKTDMEAKANYLKYLKISAKFIKPCLCERKQVHSYCQTARIIRNQKIYCEKCGEAFNLFIKKEKKCSAKLVALLTKYFLFLLIMLVCAASFLITDAFLKTEQAKEEPEAAKETIERLKAERKNNAFNWSIVPDYTKKFNI